MKQKGFTLIELLVVVAIIGTLAAIGLVAYDGYTSNAKKNASLTIHQQVVKYITNEIMKCQIDSSGTILDGHFNCSDRFRPSTMAKSIAIVSTGKVWRSGTTNPHFKHPNRPSVTAVQGYITNYPLRITCNSLYEYTVMVDNSTTEVTVTSCRSDQPGDKLISKIPIQ